MIKVRKHCYPEQIEVTDKGASVDLQSLLYHTISRIIMNPNVSLPEASERICDLKLIVKWGCDGSSGQSLYKQNFDDYHASDETIFTISMVPIVLIKESDDSCVVWKNPKPSSIRYCRPIKFEFCKEIKEKTINEVESIKAKIALLRSQTFERENYVFRVKVGMFLTMVDGKVCQALTETPSAATCYLYGANPRDMNNLAKLEKREENVSFCQFGLSTLHVWIRFMECLLHIAYRLDFGQWAARTEAQKESVKNAKERIFREMKYELGIIVDVPRQGSSNSNDGNTARRFFKNPKLISQIIRVDENLITRFGIILQVLACCRHVHFEKF